MNTVENKPILSKINVLLATIFVLALVVVWGAYLKLPLQHFDWLTAYVDQYLPNDGQLISFDGLSETIAYQMMGGNWLFRPSAAIFYHLNFIVSGANPERLALIKIGLLLVTAASFTIYISKSGLEAPKIYYALAVVFFSPSQALLMSYSPESQLACFYLMGLIAIAAGIDEKSCSAIIVGSILISLSSGFKEIGIVMSYGCVAALGIAAVFNKNLELKLRITMLVTALAIAAFSGFEFAMLSKNVQTKHLFSYERFVDNIKYLIPFQVDTAAGRFFGTLLLPLTLSGVKGLSSTLRTGGASKRFGILFLCGAMITSGILGLFALSVDAVYPPRTTPRYVYPIAICLFLPVFMGSAWLKKFSIYTSVLLIAMVWHGSAVQVNRTADFKSDEQAFGDLVGLGAFLRSLDPCVFTLSSSGKGFVETEDMLHHIYGARAKQFGINYLQTPTDLKNSDKVVCSNFKIVSTRNYLDFINDELLSGVHLRSVIETHKVSSPKRTNGFFNPIPYFESGTLPTGQIHAFRIYSFSKDSADISTPSFSFPADGDWHEMTNLSGRGDECFFPILSDTRDMDINVRYEHKDNWKEEFFKSKKSPFYEYEPRMICLNNAQKIEFRANDDKHKTINVKLIRAYPSSLDNTRY